MRNEKLTATFADVSIFVQVTFVLPFLMAEGLSSLKIVDGEQEDEEQQICNICLKDFAKYTCPRCNVRYCSLNCYKDQKHGQCSESFYKDCFITELKQQNRSQEEKKKMLEMLQRLEEKQPSDDGGGGADLTSEPTESLEERLAGLDLDREIDSVWQKLTPSEQKDFEETIKSGMIGHLVAVHKPWWEDYTPVSPLVKDQEALPSSSPHHPTSPAPLTNLPPSPAPLTNLPPLKTLLKSGDVSSCVRYNIINVIYAYAYTVRLFNGDHHDLCVQASQTLLDISASLSSNASFSSVGEALHHAMTTTKQNKELFTSNEICLSVFKDVSCILNHPKSHDCHVIKALSDVYKLLGLAKAQLKSSKADLGTDEAASKKVWLARKKVYFFAVFTNEFSDDLSPLSKVVDIEYENEKKVLEEQKKEQQRVVRRPKETREANKLIEELT